MIPVGNAASHIADENGIVGELEKCGLIAQLGGVLIESSFGAVALGHFEGEFLNGGLQLGGPQTNSVLEILIEPADFLFGALLLCDHFFEFLLRGFEIGGPFGHARFQFSVGGAEKLLRVFLLGDIADGAGDENSIRVFDRAQTDFDREFGAVPAQAVKFQSSAHGARAWMNRVIGAVRRVNVAEALRHQDFDGLSHQLFAVVAEEVFGFRVDDENAAIRIGDDHGVGRGL